MTKKLAYAICYVIFLSITPSLGNAQSISTYGVTSLYGGGGTVAPHSSGGSIGRDVHGRFEKDTYKRPSRLKRVSRTAAKYGLRVGTALVAAPVAPIVLAAGTAYGAYEVGKFAYDFAKNFE